MNNIPIVAPEEWFKQLPKPPAEIYHPELDNIRSDSEKKLYEQKRTAAIAHAIKTCYDSTQLQTLDEFEDLTAWDVIITVKDEKAEHSIVEENHNGQLTIRYINSDGTETINTTNADEIEVSEWTEVFVIKEGHVE